jgi:hypothetical protein
MSAVAVTEMGLRRHPPASVHSKCTPDPSRMQLGIRRWSFQILPFVLRPDHELRAIPIDPPKRCAFILYRRFAKPKVGPGLCEYLSQPCRIHSISLLETTQKTSFSPAQQSSRRQVMHARSQLLIIGHTIMPCKARYLEKLSLYRRMRRFIVVMLSAFCATSWFGDRAPAESKI